MKTCWFVAGPNGAGKSTLAKQYLPPECVEYVNFDEIASRLSREGTTENVMAQAGVIALRRIDQLIAEGRSFAIETTLSGRALLRRIARMKNDGWRVELHYVFIPSRKFSADRVQKRVENGGHGVAEEDINRRYARSVGNVKEYSQLCDYTACYDNSPKRPHFVSIQFGNGNPMVFDQAGGVSGPPRVRNGVPPSDLFERGTSHIAIFEVAGKRHSATGETPVVPVRRQDGGFPR